MTISELTRGRPTLEQYEVFMRADREPLFPVGRYYAGPLTDEQVVTLTKKEQSR